MVTNDPSDARLDGALRRLDHATSFVERPVERLGGSARFNPLPHAGTISSFLLLVVVVSGLYITLFFSFGHAASYDSVAAMEEHALQRIVRALHRYSSAMLVVTTLVHAWRVFTAQRFIGRQRRWRWVSGVLALNLVWLAGVTGYWLIWDRRAAAISEAAAEVLRPFGFADEFVLRHLLGVSPGTGSGFLLAIWFAHLGLTAVIGYAIYRHVRRSKLRWLPPRQWMIVMGVALVLFSVAVPVGMLGPARPDQVVADMPLDPFVLFLLPALLSSARWIALGVMVLGGLAVLVVPKFLRSDPPPVVIDADRCTGCELCVVDCPYDAVVMQGELAVVSNSACVACGICIGSCAFDAISFGGHGQPSDVGVPADLTGASVVVVCDRHQDRPSNPDDVEIPVTCAGMFAPNAVRGYHERGAESVTLVGCAPNDCRYGIGNTLATERLQGERAPHPPRKFVDLVSTSWLGEEIEAESADVNGLVRPGAVVAISVLAMVAATRAPFRVGDSSEIRVAIDHAAGQELAEVGEAAGLLDGLDVVVDETSVGQVALRTSATKTVDYVDIDVAEGTHDVRVIGQAGGESVVLFDDTVDFVAEQRLVVTATDVPPLPTTSDGQGVFDSRAAGCAICHSTKNRRDGVGPSLYGIGSVAGERVPGLDARNYLRQSILLPDQYVVDGWPAGQMLPIYRERLSEQELESLLTYLLSLEEES